MTDSDKPISAPPAAKPETSPSVARLQAKFRGDKTPTYAPEVRPTPSLRNLDQDLESEIEAAMGGMSALDMYGDLSQQGQRNSAAANPAEGGMKKGRVISIHGPDVFVSVPGGRSEGLLPMLQFPDGPPAIGDEVEIHIEGYDQANGLLLLSRKGQAVSVADWASVAEGMIVEARVLESNKGGLAVDVNGIRGFMPISQIDMYRVEDVEQFVNQKLRCVISEVSPEDRNLVVSRRALLEKERAEKCEKMWLTLAEGQIHEGLVRSVKEFGAFVDIGGVDGLLHVSEMSWQRVADAATVVQLGQNLKVVVLKIDREKRKVSLGLKQLQASPWDKIQETFFVGNVATGKVTRLMEFGAFVELEPGVEGLIHISELAPSRVRRVKDIVSIGQEVQVMILSIDPGQKRIGLSLKAALPKEPEPVEEEEEEAEEVRPARPRTTPLRGGIGEQ